MPTYRYKNTRATAFFAVAAMLAGLVLFPNDGVAAEVRERSVPKIVAPPLKPEFSDTQLKAFAAASSKIMEIRQKYWPQVQAASTEEEMLRLTKVARKEMLDTVAAHGLTIRQYDEIVAAARDDPALVKRIERLEKGS